MHTKASIFLEVMDLNISNIDKSVPPVEVGYCFYGVRGRKCIVTKIFDYYFTYEYTNPSLRNPRVNLMYMTYKFYKANFA
jgi:hypothetical protein